MRRVLILVDFSEYSGRAVQKAISTFPEAETFFIVSVLPDTYSHFWDRSNPETERMNRSKAKERLEKFISSLNIPSNTRLELRVLEGSPAEELEVLSTTLKPDIIVIGCPSGSRSKQVNTRNVISKVISKSSTPIMVVS